MRQRGKTTALQYFHHTREDGGVSDQGWVSMAFTDGYMDTGLAAEYHWGFCVTCGVSTPSPSICCYSYYDSDDDNECTNLCILCFLLFLFIYSSLSISISVFYYAHHIVILIILGMDAHSSVRPPLLLLSFLHTVPHSTTGVPGVQPGMPLPPLAFYLSQ